MSLPRGPVRVLVADDEALARQDAAIMLERLGPGFLVCGSAANGREALELAARSAPDVILLDITMPVMDGLTVMRQLSAARSRVRIVVLSGYAEFSYARQAISAGVVDYLLKPISDSAFARVMHTIAASVRREEEEALAAASAPAPWLARILHDGLGPAESDEARARLDELLPSAGRPWYSVVAVHHARVAGPPGGSLSDAVAEWFRQAQGFCSAGRRAGTGDTLALVAAPDAEGVARALDAAARAVGASTDGTSLGFSAPRCEREGLVAAAAEAREAVFHRVVEGPGRAWRFAAAAAFGRAGGDAVSGRVQAGLEAVRSHLRELAPDPEQNLRQCRGLLHGIFSTDLVTRAGAEQVRRAFAETVWLVLDRCGGPGTSGPRPAVLSGDVVDEMETLDDLVEFLSCFIAERTAGSLPRGADGRHLAAEARRIIDGRFAEPLSLRGVAEHLGLNPTYLSELFKREVGTNFSAYVTRVRTDAAKHLLTRTDLAVRDIAREVGYAYPEYFQRVFRRQEGLSPVEFRSRHARPAEESSPPA